MPILATGSNTPDPRDPEAGFSLVELLAVLAILSLMIGAVMLNLPSPRTQADRMSEAMAAQLSRFVDDGAIAGEMRALGADADGLSLFRHDGIAWERMAQLDWPDDVRIILYREDRRTDLPEVAQPSLLFEPYGSVPNFALALQGRDAEYRLSTDDRGRIVRTVLR